MNGCTFTYELYNIGIMAERFVNIDRQTPMLMPPDMRSWVPDDDLVHFVLLAVEGVPLSTFSVNHRGSGSEQYPPRMLLALLIYCYANGIFSSRRIERATSRDVGVRYLTGDTHPDHDTICKFRRENCDAVGAAFLEVLRLARELNVLKVGTISIDGTHIKANASRFHALSYHRACELDEQLRLEIDSLLKKAEEADSTGAGDPQQLPEELAHRQKLHRKVAEARQALEKRAAVAAASEQAEYERKLRERDQRPGPRKGPEPKAPDPTPSAGDQINLTDADSRIMRKSKRSEYTQSYNAQATVDADGSQLVLSSHVTNCASDAGELLPGVEGVPRELGGPNSVLADTGYVNTEAFDELQLQGVEAYVPPSRDAAGQKRDHDFRPAVDKPPKTLKDPRLVQMRDKLKTDTGRALYARRKQTVEPVFGVIKQAMGFRQFLLRGCQNVSAEWQLVCLAYNVKRLFNLNTA